MCHKFMTHPLFFIYSLFLFIGLRGVIGRAFLLYGLRTDSIRNLALRPLASAVAICLPYAITPFSLSG